MTFDDFLLQGKIRCKMPDYRCKREKAIETAIPAAIWDLRACGRTRACAA